MDFLPVDLRPPPDFFAEDLRGTFAPFSRASESPIAIACFLLVTFFPLLPEVSVPFFFRRMADSTRLLAAFPYFLPPDDFRAAIVRRLLIGFDESPFCKTHSRRFAEEQVGAIFAAAHNAEDRNPGAALIADDEKFEGAVQRLIKGIEPARHRDILMRCLTGHVSPSVALMQLLSDTEDAALVRSTVDEITSRAASLSRSSDSLLRDRVDELTQLMVERG